LPRSQNHKLPDFAQADFLIYRFGIGKESILAPAGKPFHYAENNVLAINRCHFIPVCLALGDGPEIVKNYEGSLHPAVLQVDKHNRGVCRETFYNKPMADSKPNGHDSDPDIPKDVLNDDALNNVLARLSERFPHRRNYRPYYILDANGEAVPFEGSVLEWAQWLEEDKRKVQQSNVGLYWVSTVFLGINHAFLPGQPPQVFETMIFTRWTIPTKPGGIFKKPFFHPHDLDYQERYATRAEALAGHKRAVRYALKVQIKAAPKVIGVTIMAYLRYGWWLISRDEALFRVP
jgi:hypothetical protein